MAKEFSEKFYHSQVWKYKRKEILHRDRYTCNTCKGRANEVHHKIELTPDNINDMRIALGNDNLISLCHDCHTKITLNRFDTTGEYYFNEDGYIAPRYGHK